MACEFTVLLKGWIVEDGELDVPRIGQQVSVGLGIDVERFEATDAVIGTVSAAPDPASPRGAARSRATGTAVRVHDDDGRPAFDVLTVQPGLHLVLLGDGFPIGTSMQMITVVGLPVFEPYLWGDEGLLAHATGVGLFRGLVRDVRAIDSPTASSRRDMLADLEPTTSLVTGWSPPSSVRCPD